MGMDNCELIWRLCAWFIRLRDGLDGGGLVEGSLGILLPMPFRDFEAKPGAATPGFKDP